MHGIQVTDWTDLQGNSSFRLEFVSYRKYENQFVEAENRSHILNKLKVSYSYSKSEFVNYYYVLKGVFPNLSRTFVEEPCSRLMHFT